MSYTDAEVSDHLKSLFPPRALDWVECETGDGGIGDILDGLAEETNDDGYALVDQLAKEVNPTTVEESIGEWEAALGLDGSKVAVYGTLAQRRAQVVSRLRESGTPTPTNILAAAVAIAGPTAVTILEHKRTVLDTVLSVSLGSNTATAGFTVTQTFVVHDNAPCSQAGVRFAYNMSSGDEGQFTVSLTGPDGTTKSWITQLQVDSADHWLFGIEFAGKQLAGTWTLSIDNTGGGTHDVQVDSATFYADGIGRATSGAEGLGSRIFEWSVAVDESLAQSTYDRSALCALVGRWNPAHCNGGVALWQTDGVLSALSDNTNCIADMAVCTG